MTITAYPLSWPKSFPRSKYRESGKFKTSLPNALKNVQTSLKMFASDSGKNLKNLTISSNVTLGADNPADSAVAIWFTWEEMQVCIPVDRYTSVQSNLQAIHHIIEARRVEMRHGTLSLVKASLAGFLALQGPEIKTPWQILGLTIHASQDAIKDAYKKLAGQHHPDRGGSSEKMAEINAAYEALKI